MEISRPDKLRDDLPVFLSFDISLTLIFCWITLLLIAEKLHLTSKINNVIQPALVTTCYVLSN